LAADQAEAVIKPIVDIGLFVVDVDGFFDGGLRYIAPYVDIDGILAAFGTVLTDELKSNFYQFVADYIKARFVGDQSLFSMITIYDMQTRVKERKEDLAILAQRAKTSATFSGEDAQMIIDDLESRKRGNEYIINSEATISRG
jgi:hypothetical protein